MALLSLGLMLAATGAADTALRARASPVAAPCLRAVVEAYAGPKPVVESGDVGDAAGAEILVASGAEITRAIEAGAAREQDEADVARIPWVLAVAAGNPLGVHGLADVAERRMVVTLFAGAASFEARRTLRAVASARWRETDDLAALQAAPLALVPLSLATSGERLAVDVPPIVVRATLANQTPREAEARAFLRFVVSEAGQRAFAACGAKP